MGSNSFKFNSRGSSFLKMCTSSDAFLSLHQLLLNLSRVPQPTPDEGPFTLRCPATGGGVLSISNDVTVVGKKQT